MNSLRFILICCVIALAASANLKGKNDKIIKKLKRQGYKPLGGGYWKTNFNYFFANGAYDPKLWVQLADVSGSLKNIGAAYATDAFDAYFEGKKLDDGGGLKVLKVKGKLTWYASNAFNTFYKGIRFDTSGTLKALGYGYAKDSFDSFFEGEKLEDSNGNLRITKCGYAYDSFNVYYGRRKLERVTGKIKWKMIRRF